MSAGKAAVNEYLIGTPTVTDLWVDPLAGSDSRDGLSRSSALRTIEAAWRLIPERVTLNSTGYRINLMPGVFACSPDNCQNYFADRFGAAAYPIILRAVDGPGTTVIQGGLNLRNLRYFYMLDLTLAGGGTLPTNSSGNNLLHIEASDHLLLRGSTLAGPDCANDSCNNLQEVLKVNQTSHLYVENSTIGGAWHSSVDYMVVHYGHFINNRVHTAGQWGMYVKGGSSNLRIEGNEFSGSQLGFQAGQAANFAMMLSPWLHYEARDIQFINNVMRDIPGVAISVAGGYNILIAHNTLYNVATSQDPGYPLMTFVHGERNCTATDELPGPSTLAACQQFAGAGGWGPTQLQESVAMIPNRNVYVVNNLIYNPAGSRSLYSHFGFEGPVGARTGFANVPTPSLADDGLVLRGNVIWNGPADMPLGVSDTSGCQPAHPTCSESRLRAENSINSVEPQLMDARAGNLHPLPNGNMQRFTTYPIPAFSGNDAPAQPSAPTGVLTNIVGFDKDARSRAGSAANVPGAYIVSTALSVEQRYAILRLYQVMFSAPAGADTLAALENTLRSGASIGQLANLLAGGSAFTAIYPVTLTPREFSDRFLENLFGATASPANKASLSEALSYYVDASLTRGDICSLLAAVLAIIPADDPNWGGAAVLFNAKIQAAYDALPVDTTQQ